MNSIKKLAFTALSVAALVAGAGIFGGGTASAAGSIHCVTPDLVYCTITNSNGIASVVATNHTDFGDIELVNETYPACPTEVVVILGGDTVLSAGPITFDVEQCQKLGLKGTRGDGGHNERFQLTESPRARELGVHLGIMLAK